ncbi:nucleoside recognition domain-containing protein [Acidithiobacillus sp.]
MNPSLSVEDLKLGDSARVRDVGVGFGCNVPAIMDSRIIEDPRGRILTVLMQPFMSCSARLTIYMAFAVRN